MKVNSFAKISAGIGTFAMLAAGLVMASPAQADPVGGPSDTALVGVGSDTTQDVMDAIAADINSAAGSQKLASYTSIIPDGGSHNLQTRLTNASNPSNVSAPTNVLRAKGSGDGWKLLQVAEGTVSSLSTVGTWDAANQTANKANTVGQIDYARASSLQGNASPVGEYVDIPFAVDAVDVAVNPGSAVSKIPLTLGALSDDETKPTLRSIYACKATYVYTDSSNNFVAVGNQADPVNLPDNATYTSAVKAAIAHTDAITPLLPGFGSGTAAYFIKQLFSSVTDAATFPAAGSGYECIKRTKTNGDSIQEHDGSAVLDRTNSFGVYSIGQWTAQMNHATTGVSDRTHGTVLMDLADTDPALRVPATTGTVAGNNLAPKVDTWTSTLKRNVYNIVSYRKAADPTSKIHEMFVGTSSLVCQQTAAINRMGFALMPGTDGGDPTANANACGNITNRRTTGAVNTGTFLNMTADATVTSTVASDQLQNVPFTVSVNGGTATHDMGGRVVVMDTQYDATVDQSSHVWGQATVAPGSLVATDVSVNVPATGSKKLYAYFIPTMGAFKVTTMSPVNAGVDDSFATVNVAIPDSTTKVTVRKATTLGGTSRVIAWIDSLGALPGGTVTLYKNSVSLANKVAEETISAEESAAVLSFTQDAATMNLVADFVPADGSVNPSYKDFTVTVAKATATVSDLKVTAGNNALTGTKATNWQTKKQAQAAAGVTATANAGTDLFTKNNHGLTNGNFVVFTPNAGKALPEGIIQGVGYYVIADGLTANAFKVSATLEGSALDITTAGTGFKYGLYKSPIVTSTVTGVGGVRPSGSLKFYIGTTSSDFSNEVSAASVGTLLSNGTAAGTSVATSKLPQVINWGAPVTTVPTSGKDVYLIVKYAGDDNYNEATLARKVKVKP